jgi:hypothetical protein
MFTPKPLDGKPFLLVMAVLPNLSTPILESFDLHLSSHADGQDGDI